MEPTSRQAEAQNVPGDGHEAGVSASEDLMREHGVLDRVLLIYEEGIRRIHSSEEVTPEVFQRSAELVRRFVEDYHEKLEEQFIFPVFRTADEHTDLIATLLRQHQAGRAITDAIIRLVRPERFRNREDRDRLAEAAGSFIRMYRPHSAREDTVLFPALRGILTVRQLDELGEQFEEQEHRLFGEEGFADTVAAVAEMERHLGIYNLDTFTARAPDV